MQKRRWNKPMAAQQPYKTLLLSVPPPSGEATLTKVLEKP